MTVLILIYGCEKWVPQGSYKPKFRRSFVRKTKGCTNRDHLYNEALEMNYNILHE